MGKDNANLPANQGKGIFAEDDRETRIDSLGNKIVFTPFLEHIEDCLTVNVDQVGQRYKSLEAMMKMYPLGDPSQEEYPQTTNGNILHYLASRKDNLSPDKKLRMPNIIQIIVSKAGYELLNAKNKANLTPLQVAEAAGNEHLTEVLKPFLASQMEVSQNNASAQRQQSKTSPVSKRQYDFHPIPMALEECLKSPKQDLKENLRMLTNFLREGLKNNDRLAIYFLHEIAARQVKTPEEQERVREIVGALFKTFPSALLSKKNKDNQTPLDIAQANGNDYLEDSLKPKEAVARASTTEQTRATQNVPMTFVNDKGDTQVFSPLLSIIKDYLKADSSEVNILYEELKKFIEEEDKKSLGYPSPTGTPTSSGNILHYLAAKKDVTNEQHSRMTDIVLAIIRHGGHDLLVEQNAEGKSPLEVAKANGNNYLCEHLKPYLANTLEALQEPDKSTSKLNWKGYALLAGIALLAVAAVVAVSVFTGGAPLVALASTVGIGALPVIGAVAIQAAAAGAAALGITAGIGYVASSIEPIKRTFFDITAPEPRKVNHVAEEASRRQSTERDAGQGRG